MILRKIRVNFFGNFPRMNDASDQFQPRELIVDNSLRLSRRQLIRMGFDILKLN